MKPVKRMTIPCDLTGVSFETACHDLGVDPGLCTIFAGPWYAERAASMGVGFICVPECLLPAAEAWAVECPTGIVWSEGA